jgi:hypothetical protein
MCEDLQELTGQESGIVIFEEKEAILCNWTQIKGIPRMFAGTIVGMAEEIPEVEGEHTDNLESLLDGIDIHICAEYTDDEPPKSGTVYKISDDITVIAPDGWA